MVASRAADTPTCGKEESSGQLPSGERTSEPSGARSQDLVEPEEVELLAQGQVEEGQDLKSRQSSECSPTSTFADVKASVRQIYHQEGDVAEHHHGGQEDGERLIPPLSKTVVDAPVEEQQQNGLKRARVKVGLGLVVRVS